MEKGKAIMASLQEISLTNHQTKLSDLLPDLMFNILSRVPITTLKRAKLTCKLWYSFINNPVFQHQHMARALKNPPGHLYVSEGAVHFSDAPGVSITIPRLLASCTALSSCCGLLAYRSPIDSSLYICNPITNDHVRLPNPPNSTAPIIYALGYAPVTQRYKYVQFRNHVQQDQEDWKCDIFTLGENYWSEVVVPNGIKPWTCEPVYNNGCLYLMVSVLGEFENRVMSLDLDTQKFRQRRKFHPDYLTLIDQKVTLMVLNQNLTQEVWMLINEAKDLWVKTYCFRFHNPRFDNKIMDFILSELWVRRYENDLGPDSVCDEIKKRGMSIMLNFNRNVVAAILLKLPILDFHDMIFFHFLIAHVGSLVSPSKIVEAALKQPSSASSSKRESEVRQDGNKLKISM